MRSWINTSQKEIFDKAQCEDIIKMGKQYAQRDGTVGKDSEIFEKRISTISWIPIEFNQQGQLHPMYQRLHQIVNNLNQTYFHFDDVNITEPAQYTEYTEGGFYDWHIDCPVYDQSEPMRKISMTLLLNDPSEFEGGELELMEDKSVAVADTQAKLKQGQAVFFASFLRHRVKPVTKGVRKSLVMWFTGKYFK
tara:strand:- start:338 stop:916 length:579 start_codon:yes stop_codon:yes gene_type:complete